MPRGPRSGSIQAGTFSARDVTLVPGEVLVAYTDGVIEARNPQDEEFGDARLAALVAASRGLSAADLCARTSTRSGGFAASARIRMM